MRASSIPSMSSWPPATPCRAPKLGQTMMTVGGQTLPVRANLGLYTQPISFVGLPVAAVPVWTEGETLPIGRAGHRAALA